MSNSRKLIEQARLIIFDADNTLREGINKDQKYCPAKPGEWQLMPNVKERLAEFDWGNGVEIAIATNQPGIEDGVITEEMAYQLVIDMMAKAIGRLLPRRQIEICPHISECECQCRKPQPTLLIRLMQRLQ